MDDIYHQNIQGMSPRTYPGESFSCWPPPKSGVASGSSPRWELFCKEIPHAVLVIHEAWQALGLIPGSPTPGLYLPNQAQPL